MKESNQIASCFDVLSWIHLSFFIHFEVSKGNQNDEEKCGKRDWGRNGRDTKETEIFFNSFHH